MEGYGVVPQRGQADGAARPPGPDPRALVPSPKAARSTRGQQSWEDW